MYCSCYFFLIIKLYDNVNLIRLLFILAVHCEWDEWILGECSATCGAGTRTNTRVKLVEESNGGTCDGQTIEIEECQVSECPSKYIDLRCNLKGN